MSPPRTPQKQTKVKEEEYDLGSGQRSSPGLLVTPTKSRTSSSSRLSNAKGKESSFDPFGTDVQMIASSMGGLSFAERLSSASASSKSHNRYGAVGEVYSDTPEIHTTPKSQRTASSNYYSGSPSLLRTGSSQQTSRTPWTPYTPITPYSGRQELADPVKAAQVATPIRTSLSAEEVGRYLMIIQIPKDHDLNIVKDSLADIAEFKTLIGQHLKSSGVVFITFYDPRQAEKMIKTLHEHSVSFDHGKTYDFVQCMKTEKGVIEQYLGYGAHTEGVWDMSESVIVIEILGGAELAEADLKDILVAGYGDVMWLQQLAKGRKYLAEFWDTRHAAAVVRQLHQQTIGEARLVVTYQSADPFTSHTSFSRPTKVQSAPFTLGSSVNQLSSFSPQQANSRQSYLSDSSSATDYRGRVPSLSYSHTSASSGYATPQSAFSAGLYTSRETLELDGNTYVNKHRSLPAQLKITPGASFGSFGSSPRYVPPHASAGLDRRLSEPGHAFGVNEDVWDPKARQRIPEENRVIPARIMSGLDLRTSVMVKDVPNKLSRKELVEILQESVPGGFDFVYLRFDFKNGCNVGYAFVNFITISDLYRFVMDKVGRKWGKFSSEKILQVSYANIQGKAALIEKFRNSAVMSVLEGWRPQIFYSDGRWKGQPEPFPVANNPAQQAKSQALRLAGTSAPYDPANAYNYGDNGGFASRATGGSSSGHYDDTYNTHSHYI